MLKNHVSVALISEDKIWKSLKKSSLYSDFNLEIYDAPMMIEDDISANKRSFRSSSMHKTAAAVAEQIRADILQQFQAWCQIGWLRDHPYIMSAKRVGGVQTCLGTRLVDKLMTKGSSL